MASEAVGAPPAVNKEVDERKPAKQKIDPWNVAGEVDDSGNVKAIDYDRLIEDFGVQPLTQAHLERFEKVTGKPAHRLMRRKLFFSHRDFDKILDYYEQHGQFLLYTGRGPSSGSMHLGHTVPFLFTKEIQELFDVPLVIMMTDDEKFLYTRNKNEGSMKKGAAPDDFLDYAYENIKDIIALGFDPKKTFIYSDYEFMGGHFYRNVSEFESMVTYNQASGAFGFGESTNIGLISFMAKQCVAAFPSSYPELFGLPDYRAPDFDQAGKRRHKALASIPCLIPCAIDQEPYFRVLRDRSERMVDPHPKPALIMSKFLTALQGPGGKMSASDPNSAIFMSDTPNQIKSKINKHAFSGGQQTEEEHRRLGGNPDVDVAFTYLSYFLEDDKELEDLAKQYRAGEILTGEMKAKCVGELQNFVAAFKERRDSVTPEVMREFMRPRKLEFVGNPNPIKPKAAEGASGSNGSAVPSGAAGEGAGGKDGRGTKGERKAAKLAEKKAEKEAEKLALRQKAEEAKPEV
ncbi:tryptophan--tRNA ligase [Recurvomyces mirabilis]|uniref:Tryptophan--tRNA ligase, cytoplasmic n=1 Tax=Recurvomyces mirabilis TaxID=574656 RepID=A0AAE1C5H1_9PEZI|nr:tryptophan--tRNA ligase [Recurvomyces mirabilis]KAK5161331.1 tryptophan--tRNA ligase [Recurvomyces mirabilis]